MPSDSTQDVLVIHGGNSFATREDYLAWLRGKQFTREGMLGGDWKSSLGADLGADFAVFTPRMPNPQWAQFDEWSSWFAKFLPNMSPGVILVGHSLGGIFLAKYLATHRSAVPIRAAFLVAPVFEAEGDGIAPDFALPALDGVTAQVPNIYLYHSEDDPVVPFEHLFRYQAALPGAVTSIFGNRGHFNMASFPEIMADIRAVASGSLEGGDRRPK